jgi:nitrogenase molybdenum-iron protein alpha/beta subunit
VTTHVRDAVTVIHGPKGCTHHNFSLLHATSLDNECVSMPNLISTGLSETDVVFGGEDALDRTLDSVARTDPPVIFVLSTCIVDTIGDDVAMVCSKERDMPVVLVPTAGFLGGTFPDGVNNALVAVAGLAASCEKTGGVNIIGEKNLEYEVDENFAEVKRLLAGFDLPVNCRFVHDLCTNDIAHLGAAQLNILRDPGLVPVGEFLQERFGTPYIASFPVGMDGTLSFLRSVGEACNKDYDQIVADEQALQQETIAAFRDLAGSSVSCDTSLVDTTGLFAVNEVADALHLTLATGRNRAALPVTSPIGSSGVKRMLHRWRRAINA